MEIVAIISRRQRVNILHLEHSLQLRNKDWDNLLNAVVFKLLTRGDMQNPVCMFLVIEMGNVLITTGNEQMIVWAVSL